MKRTRTQKLKPLRKWLLVAAGGLLGFAYYYFIGCVSGTCPIQSNPVMSTAYGGLVGLAVSTLFREDSSGPES